MNTTTMTNATAPDGEALAETVISAVERITRQLDAHNRPELVGLPTLVLRGLKLAEETGELAAAVIGMTGQNPRKGVTHTAADVAAEAIDVLVTAVVFAETVQPGRGFRALRLWESRAARHGHDLACVIVGMSETMGRRTDPDLTGPAALALRAMRVQAAAGTVAEAMTELLGFGQAGAWRDPDRWDTTIHAALNAVAAALVVVDAACPGQLTATVTRRLAYVADRADRLTQHGPGAGQPGGAGSNREATRPPATNGRAWRYAGFILRGASELLMLVTVGLTGAILYAMATAARAGAPPLPSVRLLLATSIVGALGLLTGAAACVLRAKRQRRQAAARPRQTTSH